ncbi:hypothetical protein A6B43_00440 [Vespertiliibacter pulmonis]|uniref:DUF6378 domain-containing protein n=1 Tax=Vespertiliibacter pulmonis TaxID=1443036 RepID=A0A3N4WJG3_9PAST|nr:DUF6378 domain-containing protein [Vespertiliibacter pulmonis]QLB20046.1 hypothetical protein A6B43_00090 [Vespertiliibacter pulmonis]QLB20112.1 hypothetical protein A6B43_00440 [Vespertiliibacter pulmonis]RPE86080.1 hypothetical protein EDC46_0472 [Vespertiliibacter pulmonis]
MNINETLSEREKTHGDFYQGAIIFDSLMEIVKNHEENLNVSHRYALTMIMGKITRILEGNAFEPDHWRDIAGYATLGGRLNVTERKDETI